MSLRHSKNWGKRTRSNQERDLWENMKDQIPQRKVVQGKEITETEHEIQIQSHMNQKQSETEKKSQPNKKPRI